MAREKREEHTIGLDSITEAQLVTRARLNGRTLEEEIEHILDKEIRQMAMEPINRFNRQSIN